MKPGVSRKIRSEYRVVLECGHEQWARNPPLTDLVKFGCNAGLGCGYRLWWVSWRHKSDPTDMRLNMAYRSEKEITMGSPLISKQAINGRMTVTRNRRGYVEVLVYATNTEDGEQVGEWEMPNIYRDDHDSAARTAERQTKKTTEGDKK